MKCEEQELIGCMPEVNIPCEIRHTMENLDRDMSAREDVHLKNARRWKTHKGAKTGHQRHPMGTRTAAC